MPASLVHGDLWSPNIMLEKNNNDEPTNSVKSIIDWQTFFLGNKHIRFKKKFKHNLGNPCADLARLLSLNTSAEYRRANTAYILQYYVEKITKAMGDKNFVNLEKA